MSKTVLFHTIQFSISTQFGSIWPIDRTLSDITTLGQCGPGNDGNEGVLHIPQRSSITGTSSSDCLVSYPGHLLREFSSSAEIQTVCYTGLLNWAKKYQGQSSIYQDSVEQWIIIISCYQHGYPWPSLVTPPYCPLLPAGPQGYILYRHRAVVCRFEQVVLSLHVHVKGSTGVPQLWAHPYFSSSVPHIWFI